VSEKQTIMEGRIPTPQQISQQAGRQIAETSPRYRGLVTERPEDDYTPVIGTERMNPGDYVMYDGTDGWVPARMYQWDGTKWEQLSIEENRWKYLDGINDLTTGAEEKVFSNVFASMLLADTAIISKIFAEHIFIKHDSQTEEMGSIQSAGYSQNSTGFIIKGNGNVEFWNGLFMGEIRADRGYFCGRLEAATGTFSGRLVAATGTFRGIVEAGTFVGSNMDISGAVNAGKNYLVKRNNMPITFSADSTIGKELPVKDLVIAATGSIRVILRFSHVKNGAGYKILCNGTVEIPTKTNFKTGTDITHDISLSSKITRITLVLTVPDVGTGSEGEIINTAFELWARDDPKFLQLLG
jgi:hypothetical protein